MAGNFATRRLTRLSKQDTAKESRRALGDVSNQAPSGNHSLANANKLTTRRSKRLSASANETKPDGEPMTSVAPRRSLRLSTGATNRDASTRNPAESSEPTRVGASQSTKTQQISGHKRSRSSASGNAGPVRKSRRKAGPKVEIREDPNICRRSCSDIINSAHTLQRHPFDASKYVAGVCKHDLEKRHDPQEVHCYVTDIFQRLFDSETKSRPNPYIGGQPALNALMRGILIDWLVEVHMKFRLLPETLYLSVNILDRYLCNQKIPRRKLQLVGVTALLLACKYEEIYPPEVKDCVYITDRAYTRQDVLDMEAHIVKTLEFRLSVSTGYPFLKRYLDLMKASSITKHLANFYMERTLQEHDSLKHNPSVLAAAAVSLAMSNPDILELAEDGANRLPGVPSTLLRYTGFPRSEILQAALLMERIVPETTCTNARRTLAAVKRKYESERYECVSGVAFTLPSVHHLDAA